MACFLVPAAEAVLTSAAMKVMKAKESASGDVSAPDVLGTPFSSKLQWLNNLLWGGSALLAFEHVWHGEVMPWFPFLTAAGNPADTIGILHEISTTGVSMSVLVTAVWLGMVAVTNRIEKRAGHSAALAPSAE